MINKDKNLIWIDLEMTGLDVQKESVLEIAVIITDGNLNIIAESPSLAIFQPSHILAGMDDWNQKQHRESGLIDRVTLNGISEAQAEAHILDLIKLHVPEKKSPMCGNSICQDRRFLAKFMPTLEAYFHYKNLDVSAISEVIKRWRPKLLKHSFKKKMRHLALEDARESLEELRYYLQHF